MKRREKESSGVELSTFCRQLKLTSADGKKVVTRQNYLTDKPRASLPRQQEDEA
jgi:hypothetical protein